MKKIAAAAILAASLLFVTACGSGEKDLVVVTVTETAPAPAPAESTESNYLSAVRNASPELVAVEDSTLVSLANQICNSLNSGVSIERVLQIGVDSGLSSTNVAAVAAGAVVFYCPGADEQ